MIHNHRKVFSVAACSATAYATSWLLAPQREHDRFGGSSSQLCQCESPTYIHNPNAPFTMGSTPASPVLPIRMIRPNPNLEIAFDTRTRTPLYVLEKLTKHSLPERGSGGGKRRPNFYEDKTIEAPEFRSKLAHYHKSGFDRGHMAPSADFPGPDTYTLCNVSPQDPVMNKGIWNCLEEWIRRLVHSRDVPSDASVYVVTGPLWLPKKQVGSSKFEYGHLGLGRPPALVAVPTHFFKVVVVVSNQDNNNNKHHPILGYACFVMGNHEAAPSKKLEDYVVPWKDLETVTGLQFFPHWATPEWKDKADQITKVQVPASVGSNGSRLFLTDRAASNKNNKSNGRSGDRFDHLCANEKCSK